MFSHANFLSISFYPSSFPSRVYSDVSLSCSSSRKFHSSSIHIDHSSFGFSLNSNRLLRCFRAGSPGPPPSPPPQPDPSGGNKLVHHRGFAATFARFRDTLQIFLAVLFWMSLFFWASAWDGRNKGNRWKK